MQHDVASVMMMGGLECRCKMELAALGGGANHHH